MNDITETTETQTQPAAAPEISRKKSSGTLWIVLVVLVVLLGLLFGYTQGMFGSAADEQAAVGDSADPTAVVATVNGETITRGELNEKIAQVKNTMPAGTIDPTKDATFELVVLDEMINVKLLVAKADALGYTASDADVDAEIETLISLFGGEEALESQLALTGITRENLRENMRNEIRIRKLVSAETDVESVEVTEEEVQLAYDTAVGDSEGAASFEDVHELLRTQLLQQKSTTIIDQYIQTLRNDALIEVTL